MKYFSMFTGIGGFELGIGNKGECVGFCEIDKYANQLLTKRFPSIKNYGDVTKILDEQLPEFDMLCGGFPCQSFSIAGKRRGFNDTRGTMFFEVARIAKAKRPKIIFLENVKGLLNHNKGETFRIILETLVELGYEVQWMVLNSKFFGVPQNRERVFIIGSLRGESRPEILPIRQHDSKTIEQRDSEGMEQTAQSLRARDFSNWNGNYIKYYNMSNKQHDRVYEQEGISPTLAGASKLSGDCTPKIVASRGRNPNNPSDRTTGAPTEQRLEENSEGISNSLTSINKDNMVLLSHSPGSGDPKRGGTGALTSTEHSFTLDSTPHNDIMGTKIRRLTPIECERLQGFPDNWTEGFSDTQRYKMLGNTVTVNVIKAITERLLWNRQ